MTGTIQNITNNYRDLLFHCDSERDKDDLIVLHKMLNSYKMVCFVFTYVCMCTSFYIHISCTVY